MYSHLSPHALGVILWLHVLGGHRSPSCLAQILHVQTPDVEFCLEMLKAQALVEGSMQHWRLAALSRQDCLHCADLLSVADESQQTRTVLLLTREPHALSAYLALQTLTESLMAASSTKGASACLKLLIDCLRHWDPRQSDPASQRTFMDLVLMAQSNAFYVGVGMPQALQLSEQADMVARLLGDSRSLALARLIAGCLGSLSGQGRKDSLKTLKQGVDAINSMGDSDILEQASYFLSWLHYVQGEFRETFRYFEAAQHCAPMFKCRYFNEMFPVYMVPAALYMGYYPQALGMVLAALDDAEAQKNFHGVLWWNTLLAVVYLRLGLPHEALPHLEQVLPHTDAESDPKLRLWALRALALYHADTGQMATAHATLRACLEEHGQLNLRFPYTAPWILELFFRLEEHGLPALPGYGVEEECSRVLQGPNKHLHGAAYRVLACKLRHEGVDEAGITGLLQRSVESFEAAGNRADALLSVGLLHEVQRGRAGDALSTQAARNFTLCEVEIASPQEKDVVWRGWFVPGEGAVRACLEDMGHVDPRLPLRHVYSRIVGAIQRHLGAECALLLHWAPASKWTLAYGSNCSAAAFERRNYGASVEACETLLHEDNFILLIHRQRAVLALKIDMEGEQALCLWLESRALAGLFIKLEPADNVTLARAVAAELRTALKIEAARQAEIQCQHVYLVAAMEESAPVIRYDNGRGLHTVLEQAKYAAQSDAPILLLGETGVGKEVLARRIHQFSGRKGAFVPVMPASTPETLFESEFFGHEKGAFTGAVRQKVGLFELANDGTFFIDEVGELPLTFQTKLLRVLQEKSFMRVGGTRSITSNFRLLTATNRDLWSEVQNGHFREDLYYRISIIPITIPPLRQRPEDIPGLVQMFMDDFAARYRKNLSPLSQDDMRAFMQYHWPGNVRELKNVVERAVILSSEKGLDFSFGPGAALAQPAATVEALYADMPTLEELTVRYMRHVLQLTGGRIIGHGGAENILGMKRSTLYAKLRQYGFKEGARRR